MGRYDPWDAFFTDLEGSEHRFTMDDFAEMTGLGVGTVSSSSRLDPLKWCLSISGDKM
jgi:hypothetical protein